MLAAAQRWPVSDDKIGAEYKVKRFLEGCLMAPARAHVYWNGTFSDRERRELVQRALPPSLESVLRGLSEAKDGVQPFLAFDQKYYLPDDILAKVDRTSMAHSIEVRPPFLDHRIVEFANSLPAYMKIQGKRQKVILRNLMQGKLGPDILQRRKTGFDIPAHDWFRGPLRPVLEEALAFAAAEHGDFFNMTRIREHVRAHLERRANLGFHLWGLTILFYWMKKWRIQTGTPGKPARQTMENAFTSI